MNLTEIISKIPELTEKQILSEFHNLTVIPSVIIIYLSTSIVLGLLGFMVKGDKSKFRQIYFWFMLFSTLICIAVILLPNIVQILANLFR